MTIRLDAGASGVFTIAVTPFTPEGGVDLGGTDALVEFYLERGATGLTILGIMGEATKLSTAEAMRFARHVLKRVDARVPVVVGVSSAGFAQMHELAESVMDDGAAGVMIAPPSTLRTEDSVLAHMQHAAETLGDTPIVLQDFPLASGVHMSVNLIRRVIEQVPSCVMLKAEDWPGLGKISALRDAPGLRRVSILTGNGGLFLPEELRRGADGAMTGFAFPEMMRDVVAAHRAGDFSRAADVFDAYLPLVRYEQQPGIGLSVRKYVLCKRGAIAHATMRAPYTALSGRDMEDVAMLMARQERRLAALG
jgi:4-hydroxy-tetrahydrodipicolinate synthase